MCTDKQRVANRRNALLSSGPRTIDGKARSAQNSFKHGLCADDSTLYDDPETKADIEQLLARYFDYYQPESPLEQDALEEIAVCKIRLRHLQRAQVGLINDAREKMFDKHTFTDPEGRHWFYDSAAHAPGDERFVANRLLGIAWQSVAADLDKMSRYEARIHSRYQKALKTFEALRRTPAQPGLQNEPNSGLSPVETTVPKSEECQPAERAHPAPRVSGAEPTPGTRPQPTLLSVPPPTAPRPIPSDPTLQNEPNSDLTLLQSTPISGDPR